MPASRNKWLKYRDKMRERLREEQGFIDRAVSGKLRLWQVENGREIDMTADYASQSRATVKVMSDIIAAIERDFL
jgi:hypothetical protein